MVVDLIVIVKWGNSWAFGNHEDKNRVDACHELKPGCLKSDVFSKLGKPESIQDEGEFINYVFHTPRMFSAPIHARVLKNDDRVVSLGCGEESGYWNSPIESLDRSVDTR